MTVGKTFEECLPLKNIKKTYINIIIRTKNVTNQQKLQNCPKVIILTKTVMQKMYTIVHLYENFAHRVITPWKYFKSVLYSVSNTRPGGIFRNLLINFLPWIKILRMILTISNLLTLYFAWRFNLFLICLYFLHFSSGV